MSLNNDGSRIAVGSYGFSSATGKVSIFTYNTGTSTWSAPAVVGQGTAGADNYGISISLSASGDLLLVGSPGDTSQSGKAYVYIYTTGSWGLSTSVSGGSSDGLGQGVSVSPSGNRIAIGRPGYSSGTGYVDVLTYNTGTSTWGTTNSYFTGPAGSNLGSAVALSDQGADLVAGAPLTSTSAGAAYLDALI